MGKLSATDEPIVGPEGKFNKDKFARPNKKKNK